jgi:hypothetical protein
LPGPRGQQTSVKRGQQTSDGRFLTTAALKASL